MSAGKIKVLLVDDSQITLSLLKRALAKASEIEVVGTARDGAEALELIPRLQPNVICTDLHMPRMNGLELTREIMTRFPKPILVVSVSVEKDADAQNVFSLLEAGAVDVYSKPRGGQDIENTRWTNELISKIKILSGVIVFRKALKSTIQNGSELKPITSISQSGKVSILAIGTSTGGPKALQTILPNLPGHFPIPVVCVQHISTGFLSGLIEWLSTQCKLKIKIAQPGEPPRPGFIYFPPEERHLEMDYSGNFVLSACSRYPAENHCPSVNVMFNSVAEFYGRTTLGIILTGMGSDGAEGMQRIYLAGGTTIAQDEKSCVVFGMPQKAIELKAIRYVLSIDEISAAILKIVGM